MKYSAFKFVLPAILVVFVTTFAADLHAIDFSPTDGSGNGAITLSINNAAPYTHFGADFIVSSLSGRYSHVLPCGSSLATPTAFYDTDYTVSENPLTHELLYSPAYSGFYPQYCLRVFGHPRLSPGTILSGPGTLTPGLTGDFADVPAGKYTLEYTVNDVSVVYEGGSGSVSDADYVHEFDIYLMDLAERERTVYMMQNDVYRLDLSTVPAEFPHENCCYLTVAWAAMPMPGMNIVSDLYTDASCNNMIAPDTSGGVSKTWQIGNVPHYIYFKMPAFGKSIDLSLTATNNIQTRTLAQKTIFFTTTGLYCHKARNSELGFYDYCNHLLYQYPRGLWKDNETISGPGLDGFAYEAYNYQNNAATEDKNTPFVVKKGDKLKLTELELADKGTNTYNGTTDYITGANTSFPFGSSHFTVIQENGYKLLRATDDVESVNAVSNTVGIRYLSLPWKVQTSGGSNIASGSSDIKVYVPLDTPLLTFERCNLYPDYCLLLHNVGLFESLLDISCSAAEGASTESGVFDLLWNKLQTCNVSLLDGTVLTYWGLEDDTLGDHMNTEELLQTGHGRCEHWSSLFVDLMKSQGIDANYEATVLRFQIGFIPSAGIVFNGSEAIYNGNQYPSGSIVCLRQHGTKFQGNGDPHSVKFQNHVINVFNNKLYDATCGKGGYDFDVYGLTQYLQENVYITIVEPNGDEHTLLSGSEVTLDHFLFDFPENEQ